MGYNATAPAPLTKRLIIDMLISNHQLTQEQYLEVSALAGRCRQQDGNTIPIFGNVLMQYRTFPSNLLYYHEQNLIGFLSAFFFYENACELTLMVDPNWRRQHIASQLIASVAPILEPRDLEYILCPSPSGLNNDWLMQRGLQYNNSEVQMRWEGKHIPTYNHADMTISSVTNEEDISMLADIDVICFNTNKSEMELRYARLLSDPTYNLIILRRNQQPIGKAHLHLEIDQIQLSDIAVLPDFQGQGFGQALVAYSIEHAHNSSHLPLILDVDLKNLNALHIYQKLGFKSINAWDYWVMNASRFLQPFIA